MKLYLAAPYAARDFVRGVGRTWSVMNGFVITSGWLNASRAITPATTDAAPGTELAEVVHHAKLDLDEVQEADALVHFTAAYLISVNSEFRQTPFNLHSGGRHVETGFALALGKPVVVIGEPENIFQRGLCTVVPGANAARCHLIDLSTPTTPQRSTSA